MSLPGRRDSQEDNYLIQSVDAGDLFLTIVRFVSIVIIGSGIIFLFILAFQDPNVTTEIPKNDQVVTNQEVNSPEAERESLTNEVEDKSEEANPPRFTAIEHQPKSITITNTKTQEAVTYYFLSKFDYTLPAGKTAPITDTPLSHSYADVYYPLEKSNTLPDQLGWFIKTDDPNQFIQCVYIRNPLDEPDSDQGPQPSL